MLTLCIIALVLYAGGAVLLEVYQRWHSDDDLLPIKRELETYFGREVAMSELESEYDRMIAELEQVELEECLGHQVAIELEVDRQRAKTKHSGISVDGRRNITATAKVRQIGRIAPSGV